MIISQITGLPIDGYVSVNFNGFYEAIDILGGVDIDVEKSFIDPNTQLTARKRIL